MIKKILCLSIVTVMLTGCNDSKQLSSIPEEYRNEYKYVYFYQEGYYLTAEIVVNANEVKFGYSSDYNKPVDVEFGDDNTYIPEDITKIGNKVKFNLYSNNIKKYECEMNKDKIRCTSTTGYTETLKRSNDNGTNKM